MKTRPLQLRIDGRAEIARTLTPALMQQIPPYGDPIRLDDKPNHRETEPQRKAGR